MGTHKKHIDKALLMSTHNLCFYGEISKIIHHLSQNTDFNEAAVIGEVPSETRGDTIPIDQHLLN